MNSDEAIPIVFRHAEEQPLAGSRGMLPYGKVSARLVEQVSRRTLSESLSRLVEDVDNLIDDLRKQGKTKRLKSFTVAAEISATEGFQWIGSVDVNATNAVTLEFSVDE